MAYMHGNPASLSPYSKVAFIEPIVRETTSAEAQAWACFDYEHTPSEAFKALPSDVIVHLPPPTWTRTIQPFVVMMPPN